MHKRRALVVECMLKGMRNKEIAQHLGIAEKTVKDHLWREFKAVGVKTRTEFLIKMHNEKCSREVGQRVADIITGGLDGTGQLTRSRY
jgi:DNA-binding NarL/FixJ family response regulator